ncbi:hypothetical protein C8R43DRAFT_1121731 [Mycena crocata]|nr:hypothetical protein C8R43DRAFT_1121731 [Mycena crocata]
MLLSATTSVRSYRLAHHDGRSMPVTESPYSRPAVRIELVFIGAAFRPQNLPIHPNISVFHSKPVHSGPRAPRPLFSRPPSSTAPGGSALYVRPQGPQQAFSLLRATRALELRCHCALLGMAGGMHCITNSLSPPATRRLLPSAPSLPVWYPSACARSSCSDPQKCGPHRDHSFLSTHEPRPNIFDCWTPSGAPIYVTDTHFLDNTISEVFIFFSTTSHS